MSSSDMSWIGASYEHGMKLTERDYAAWRPQNNNTGNEDRKVALPNDAQERKSAPIYSGVLKYFPDAIAYVSRVSKAGNDQHNPGQPLHWDRSKSSDHLDCLIRHAMDAGEFDLADLTLHSGKAAWRSLANLQEEIEGWLAKGVDVFDANSVRKWMEGKREVAADQVANDDGWIPVDPDSPPKVKYDCMWSDGDIWMGQEPGDTDHGWRRCCHKRDGHVGITHWRPSKES